MEKQAIKDLIYGSLSEIVRNSDYYAYWSNKFTPRGERSVIEFFNTIGPLIKKCEEEDLNQRSKNIVMNSLKGEKE